MTIIRVLLLLTDEWHTKCHTVNVYRQIQASAIDNYPQRLNPDATVNPFNITKSGAIMNLRTRHNLLLILAVVVFLVGTVISFYLISP